jgi:hypothetical protein
MFCWQICKITDGETDATAEMIKAKSRIEKGIHLRFCDRGRDNGRKKCPWKRPLKGRLHSRFLRPLSRPQLGRRPTASFAFLARSRTRSCKGSCWAVAPSRTEKRTRKNASVDGPYNLELDRVCPAVHRVKRSNSNSRPRCKFPSQSCMRGQAWQAEEEERVE